jgi:hypothetical protein
MITKNIVETPVYAILKNKEGVIHHLFVNGGGKFFWDSSDLIFDNEDAAINFMRAAEDVEEIRCVLPESNKRRRS